MPLSTNLIAAWEGNEASGNAPDSTASGLTLTDNNTVTSGTGLVNALARLFTAANSESLTRASEAALVTGDIDFSFEAWFKATTIPGDGSIVCKASAFITDYRIYLHNAVGPVLETDGTTVTWGTALSTATWYQVICWHDATANQLGITVNDGTPQTVAEGNNNTSTGVFAIGKRGSNNDGYFNGLIGPVRFWKRMLTSLERTELYNGGAGRTYAYITGGGGGGGGGNTSDCAAQYYNQLTPARF